jgi:NRPS condensation-like uncharacterized protein
MQNFTKLKAWQKGHNFTVNLYKLTASFSNQKLRACFHPSINN